MIPYLRASLTLMLVVLLSGCAEDPSKSVPKAKISDPAPKESTTAAKPEAATTPSGANPTVASSAPATATPPAAPAGEAQAEPGAITLGGSIGFVGSKVTGKHEGVFTKWSGKAILGETDEDLQLSFTVQVGSVFSDPKSRNEWSPKLDEHLRSKDFFNADEFPTATFQSTEIRVEPEGANSHVVKGDLTLRGVTKSVSFPARFSLGGDRISGRAEFTINRKDFGIEYPGKPDDLIRDGVVLTLRLTGKR